MQKMHFINILSWLKKIILSKWNLEGIILFFYFYFYFILLYNTRDYSSNKTYLLKKKTIANITGSGKLLKVFFLRWE